MALFGVAMQYFFNFKFKCEWSLTWLKSPNISPVVPVPQVSPARLLSKVWCKRTIGHRAGQNFSNEIAQHPVRLKYAALCQVSTKQCVNWSADVCASTISWLLGRVLLRACGLWHTASGRLAFDYCARELTRAGLCCPTQKSGPHWRVVRGEQASRGCG